MGWYGLQRAILDQEVPEIVEELSLRRNPNDPESALYLAVRQMTEQQCTDFLGWADTWLRDPDNDCLRARGDVRWNAVCRVERMMRSQMRVPAGSSSVVSGGDAGNEGDFLDSEYSGF